MLDRCFKNELTAVIRAIITRCLHELRDENEEVWLSKDEFLAQFGMFTDGWLKEYGDTLPRTQAIVIGESGDTHATRWAYPRNKIQRMIRENSIKQLKVNEAAI